MLALHFLPRLSIGDTELRRVSVLGDLLPEIYEERDVIDVIPELPDAPQPITVTPCPPVAGSAGSAVTGVSEGIPSANGTNGTAPANGSDVTVGSMSMIEPSGTDNSVSGVTPAVVSDSIAPEVTPILDYSQGQAGGMYHFYHSLANARQLGRPVRVAYYGDSFIEGDIFTADLRELLQDKFGGSGVGWVDCASQVSGFRQSVKHTANGIHEFEVVKHPFSHANQGIAQRYFTVSEGARITYKGATSRRHQGQWDKALFYLRTDGGLTLRTTVNGDTTVVDTVAGSPNLQAILCSRMPKPGDSLQALRPMSSVSFNISRIGNGTLLYGVALEPETGVVVDNFSMRGSAGFTLSQIPAATLSQFAARRPYDLIVIHYGLNVASDKQGNYSAYTKRMGDAIEHLRQAYPQTSILIVSMPDRDQRTDAGIRTMKGVEALVAYQQIMASEHGVSFFNLFQAMGGRESMKALVDRGLANKDYTHINFAGGKHLAKLLFESIMAGYHSYGY